MLSDDDDGDGDVAQESGRFYSLHSKKRNKILFTQKKTTTNARRKILKDFRNYNGKPFFFSLEKTERDCQQLVTFRRRIA